MEDIRNINIVIILTFIMLFIMNKLYEYYVHTKENEHFMKEFNIMNIKIRNINCTVKEVKERLDDTNYSIKKINNNINLVVDGFKKLEKTIYSSNIV